MLARAKVVVSAGVNIIVLLALHDDDRPAYDANDAFSLHSAARWLPARRINSRKLVTALKRQVIWTWAAATCSAQCSPYYPAISVIPPLQSAGSLPPATWCLKLLCGPGEEHA